MSLRQHEEMVESYLSVIVQVIIWGKMACGHTQTCVYMGRPENNLRHCSLRATHFDSLYSASVWLTWNLTGQARLGGHKLQESVCLPPQGQEDKLLSQVFYMASCRL